MFPPVLSPVKWARKTATSILSALSYIVFLFLDFLEVLFCVIYRHLDEFFEGKTSPCYCESKRCHGGNVGDGEDSEFSETLYGRKNVFRQMGFLGFARKRMECRTECAGGGNGMINRWSDCGCETCISWKKDGGDNKLFFAVREPSEVMDDDSSGDPSENVIFLHGFLSSSLFWTETVFPNLSESVKRKYRLFAVDLLGFGRSPKPRDCLYTLSDHIEMIEKSVISPFQLKSFHLVAHSMGCIIAVALAAKYPKLVKSITLIAPPYFINPKEGASLVALQKLAERRIWPPLLFGSSFMSWYEHLGRCVCFVFCRNHRVWERILKILTWRRDLHFMIKDMTRHTHHSAWHNMHNVICGGAKFMDNFLETLFKFRVNVCVIQGDRDNVVLVDCSYNIKKKVPDAEVNIISNANHGSVVIGREKDFTHNLEHIWASFATEICSEEVG